MKLTLIGVRPETEDVTSFLFELPSPSFSWTAGEYLRYQIDDPLMDGRRENRIFSISSAPYEKVIMLTTKFIPGDGSTFKWNLKKLKIGDSINATGPGGMFSIEDSNLDYIFIAGGIGITPYRSMILDLNHRNLPINITLLYASRTEDIIFKKELEEVAVQHPEFKILYFIGKSRINRAAIRQIVAHLIKPMFYISGPELMMQSFELMLAEMGVPNEHFKRDYFPGYTGI